jgi:4-hydroxybenzoate polyprenyltransferase
MNIMSRTATQDIQNSIEVQMDSTLLRAGRTTHLKIVVVALAAAIAVVAIGVNAGMGNFATARTPIDAASVVKASWFAVFAGEQETTIR